MILEYLRKDETQPGLIFNGPAGNCATKTAALMDAASIALVAGLKIGLVDGGQPSRALTEALENSKIPVENFDDEYGDGTKILEKYRNADIIFQDNGDTGLMDQTTMAPAVEIIRSVGISNSCLFLNQTPLNPGLANNIEKACGRYNWVSKRLLRIDTYSSVKDDDFRPLPESGLQIPVVSFPYLNVSQVDVYTSRKILPAELLQNPPANFQLVCKQIARRLLNIAQSNNFAAFLGAGAAIPKLQAMAAGAPEYAMVDGYISDDDALFEYNGFQRCGHKTMVPGAGPQYLESCAECDKHLHKFLALWKPL